MATERRRAARLRLPPERFTPWEQASGQRLSTEVVEPLAVTALPDLLGLHADAGIELRIVPSLWPLHDLAVADRWDFSIVRMRNALPRP